MTNRTKRITYTRSIILEIVLYGFVLFIMGVFYLLFFRKYLAHSWDGNYHIMFAEMFLNQSIESMQEVDINIPVQSMTYPLFHLTVKALASVIRGNYYAAAYVVLAGTVVLAALLFRILFQGIYQPKRTAERMMLDLLSIFSVVFLTARGPLTDWRFYARQCGANPVHNPTLLYSRPFGILSFLFFVRFLEKYDKKEKYIVDIVLYAVTNLLCIFSKPSFAFVFMIAEGFVILAKMIQKKDLRVGCIALVSVIPSIAVLFWQFNAITGASTIATFGIQFGSFSNFRPMEVLAVSLATFPVPLLLFSSKIFSKDHYYQLAYLALAVGWIEMFFLTNGPSGDFSWGYDLAVQFSTVIALVCALKYRFARWRIFVSGGIFLYQVICGIQYIIQVFSHYEILI